MLTLMLLAAWFVIVVFGAHDGVLTGTLLVCCPLCSFMGAVAGTTVVRSVFGRSTPGEADFEALGTIMGGGLVSLIAATVACLAGMPGWAFATATVCTIIGMTIWYRLLCVRYQFLWTSCRRCGGKNFLSYYDCESPHQDKCDQCGFALAPSAEELRKAVLTAPDRTCAVSPEQFAERMAQWEHQRQISRQYNKLIEQYGVHSDQAERFVNSHPDDSELQNMAAILRRLDSKIPRP